MMHGQQNIKLYVVTSEETVVLLPRERRFKYTHIHTHTHTQRNVPYFGRILSLSPIDITKNAYVRR